MGKREGVVLPENVEVKFAQFMDDFLGEDATKKERREYFFWGWLESVLRGDLGVKLVEANVIGGLGATEEGLKGLKEGRLGGGGGKVVVRVDVD
jgi:hypothetical protein